MPSSNPRRPDYVPGRVAESQISTMIWVRRFLVPAALIAVTAMLVTQTAASAAAVAPTKSAPGAVSAGLAIAGPSPGPVHADWSALAGRAKDAGTVPVIVGLRAPAIPLDATAREQHFHTERTALASRLARGARRLAGPDGAPFVTLRATQTDLLALKASGEVSDVTADGISQVQGTSPFGGDPGQQLPQMWDVGRIGADWANANGWTGKGMKIAVIDTGVDTTNPYLTGKVVNEACFAHNPDGSGGCNNGGLWQYATTTTGSPGSAAPCFYASACSHGTHVAHTAAGAYGVARGASLVAIRAAHKEWDVKSRTYLPKFADSDLLNALWYVHDVLPKAGIVVAAINMSVGKPVAATGTCDAISPQITNYITALRNDYQIPTVIATGNDDDALHVSFPACVSSAVAVGNTTLTSTSNTALDAVFGNAWGGSNSSPVVDLLAPGTDICSAVPKGLDDDGTAEGWNCGWIGTSMAAPHVAGAIAILTQKRPTATVSQYLNALATTGAKGGIPVTDSRNNLTRTRINIATSVYYF
jgi:subtilisin